jgi:hypothetical protein
MPAPGAHVRKEEVVGDIRLERRADGNLYAELSHRKVARQSVVKRFKTERAAAGIRTDTQLAELREALEDEKEADKFLGDPMFWRDYNSIEQSRIFRVSSVEYRNLWIMFWETVFYLSFVLIFTSFALEMSSDTVYECRSQQKDYWLGCDASGCSVDRVTDVTSLWTWLQEDFLERTFPQNVEPLEDPLANITTTWPSNGYSVNYYPLMVGETNTIVLLGAVRFRQQRVRRQEGCMVSPLFRHVFPDCFPDFKPAAKSMESFGTRYTPTYLLEAYEFANEEKTRAAPLLADMAEYPADGFMFDLPADRKEARVMLQDLWDWEWIDQSTRAVVIEMTVLNTNTNVIQNTRIFFELGATGAVRPGIRMNAFRVMFTTWAFNEGAEMSVFITQMIVFFMFVAMITYQAWLIKRTGVKFFQYGWNLLDLVNIALWIVYVMLRVQAIRDVEAEETLDPYTIGHPHVFSAFSRHMVALTTANQVLSILSLCVYIKILKYLPMVSYFRTLEEVLVTCVPKMLSFAVLIIVLFYGFGVAFFVGLGQTSISYARLSTSFLRLFFMFIEGVNIDPNWFRPVEFNYNYTGPLMSLTYLILVYFILANMFMAIVVGSYVSACMCRDVRVTGEDLEKRNPMVLFLYTYYHSIRKLSLLSDDEALPEEQSINLGDLPGIVVRKWLEKKRRMHLLIDQNLGEVSDAEMKRRMAGHVTVENTANSTRKRKKKSIWKHMTTCRKAIQRAMSLPSSEDFEIPEPEQVDSKVRLYVSHESLEDEIVSLQQLQALLDQEATLQILLGTKNALDVIRYFKPGLAAGLDPDNAEKNTDPLDKVAEMQEGVFRKIDHLEKKSLNMNRNHVPFVDDMAEEISHAITSVQNEWREELTRLIEQMTHLADGFKEMKAGMDGIVRNHNELSSMLRDDDMGGSESSSSSYSSEEGSEQIRGRSG